MRTNPIKTIAAALTLTLTALGLVACSDTPPPGDPGALAIVHANRANTAAVDAATIPDITTLAQQSAKHLDTVTIITTDGQPSSTTTLKLQNNGNNDTTRAQQDATNTATVLTAITHSAPVTGEANPLRGITIAADAIRRATGPKLLVIIDNGLQTVAPLRFQDGLLDPATDPNQIAQFVQSVGAVPDLTGINIIWIGIAKTAEPQTPLTTPAENKVKNIWDTILHAGNPANVTFIDTPLDDPAPANTPAVTAVTIPDLDSYNQPQPTKPTLTAPFESSTLGFLPDQAVLADPDKAQQIINTTAAILINGNYQNITITGTTANDGPTDGQTQLSRDRANTISDLLIKAGVPANHLTNIQGLGSNFPGYIPDHNPDGTLNETTAALNRLVIITAT